MRRARRTEAPSETRRAAPPRPRARDRAPAPVPPRCRALCAAAHLSLRLYAPLGLVCEVHLPRLAPRHVRARHLRHEHEAGRQQLHQGVYVQGGDPEARLLRGRRLRFEFRFGGPAAGRPDAPAAAAAAAPAQARGRPAPEARAAQRPAAEGRRPSRSDGGEGACQCASLLARRRAAAQCRGKLPAQPASRAGQELSGSDLGGELQALPRRRRYK